MTNLLRNPVFCDGHHHQDGIPQVIVPDDWWAYWLDGEPFAGIAPGLLTARPEYVNVDLYTVSPEDQAEFFYLPNGESTRFALKIFKSHLPMYAGLAQTVGGLRVGQRYRFAMWAYPDIVESYGPKVFSGDVWAAESRVGVGPGAMTPDEGGVWSPWHNVTSGTLAYGEYGQVALEFVAPAETVTVFWEAKCKWGLANNGFWLWGAELLLMEDAGTPQPPIGGAGVVELGPLTLARLDRIAAALEALPGFSPGVPTPPEPEPVALTTWSQNDPRWKDEVYAGGMTFGRAGCLVVSVAMLASLAGTPAPTPVEVAAALRAVGAFDGALLSRPERIPQAIPQLSWGGALHWRDRAADRAVLEREIAQYGATICEVKWDPGGAPPQDGNQHFVVVTALEGDEAWIVDPWDGQRKRLSQSRYVLSGWGVGRAIYGVRLVRPVTEETPPEAPGQAPLLGLHDELGEGLETGAQWLIARGLRGLVVRPIYLGTTAQMLDFSAAAAAGLQVLVNLRYSYARDNGGAGTFPLPGTPAWYLFVEAAARTMITSRGVWGWEVGNEANNPREFPDDGPLTATDVAQTYDAIRERVWQSTARPRMAPGALDPFNAEAGDPRDWLRRIWTEIQGAEFVGAHGYVRGPDPALVGSTARFADAPLQWQYLNFPGCVTALLQALPAQYVGLPVYVTEFNHLWTTGEGNWGWVDDARAAEVVRRARGAATAYGFAGLALYRWAGDAWGIQNNQAVLGALVQGLQDG